jgi:hypothetical protein
MCADVIRVPVAEAGRSRGVRVGEADVFLAGLGQGAFEVAGDLTEQGSVAW